MASCDEREVDAADGLLAISSNRKRGTGLCKSPQACSKSQRKKHNGSSMSFPKKLMIMINWCKAKAEKELSTPPIIWLCDGDGFLIQDPRGLKTCALPLFFKSVKYESFIRKLYRWGFKKTSSANGSIYRANNFDRDHPHLIDSLKVQYSEKEITVQKCQRIKHGFKDPQSSNSACAETMYDSGHYPTCTDLNNLHVNDDSDEVGKCAEKCFDSIEKSYYFPRVMLSPWLIELLIPNFSCNSNTPILPQVFYPCHAVQQASSSNRHFVHPYITAFH